MEAFGQFGQVLPESDLVARLLVGQTGLIGADFVDDRRYVSEVSDLVGERRGPTAE